MTTQAQRVHTVADPGRVDLRVVASFVDPGARVLDIGCGDGALLKWLEEDKQVDGRGIELSQKGVNEAVARGVSVVQGDADSDLANYPDDAFDFVILSQTLQATRNPRLVLEELLRIGRKAIVSFPNFGHWRVRWTLTTGGRMPITQNLPCSWYDTPNIHFCTVRDFLELTDAVGARIEAAVGLWGDGRHIPESAPWAIWNLCAEQAILVLSRRRH